MVTEQRSISITTRRNSIAITISARGRRMPTRSSPDGPLAAPPPARASNIVRTSHMARPRMRSSTCFRLRVRARRPWYSFTAARGAV